MSGRFARIGIGAASLLCAFGLTAAAAEGRDALRLSAAQREFLRQEPILVTLRAEGDAAPALPAVLGGESPAPSLWFEIVPAVKPRAGAKPLPEEARAASSRSRKYDLLEWFEFPAGGTFKVKAVYESAGARLASAPIAVVVRSPKPGDADFDAVARIHHIPWSNYETNAYCGDTFDVVKRWPESKLAPYCRYWNGRYSQNKKEYDKAIASYEELIAKHPNFALADDARRGIEESRKARDRKPRDVTSIEKPNAKMLADNFPAALIYPGAVSCGFGGGGGGSAGKPARSTSGNATAIRTADSFEAVSAFYSKAIIGEEENVSLLDRRMHPRDKGVGGSGATVLGGGDKKRPVKMVVYNNHSHFNTKSESTTVVLTRGEHEDWTYIHIVMNAAAIAP